MPTLGFCDVTSLRGKTKSIRKFEIWVQIPHWKPAYFFEFQILGFQPVALPKLPLLWGPATALSNRLRSGWFWKHTLFYNSWIAYIQSPAVLFISKRYSKVYLDHLRPHFNHPEKAMNPQKIEEKKLTTLV